MFTAAAQAGGSASVEAFSNFEEGSINNPEAIAHLSVLPEIAKRGYLMEGTVALNHTQAQTEMMLGKALFYPVGVWIENEMSDAPREEGFEFGMMAFPAVNAGDTRYIASNCEQFSIPANAKNPEAAKAFLKFLYSDESIIAFAKHANAIYAMKHARELVAEHLSPGVYNMFEAYNGATAVLTYLSPLPQGSKIEINPTLYHNHVTAVINGEKTVEAWVADIEEAFAEIRADIEAAQ
jgi:N-acetylglucosamine transport system substrate-binding protein